MDTNPGPLKVPYPSPYQAQQMATSGDLPDYSAQVKKNEDFMKEMWLSKMTELELQLAPIRAQAEEATKAAKQSSGGALEAYLFCV